MAVILNVTERTDSKGVLHTRVTIAQNIKRTRFGGVNRHSLRSLVRRALSVAPDNSRFYSCDFDTNLENGERSTPESEAHMTNTQVVTVITPQ